MSERKPRTRPIFGTDLTKEPPVLIEGIRDELARIRGQLYDIGREWPGWGDRLDAAQGLLTCGIIALHSVRAEMEETAKRWAKESASAPAPARSGEEG